MQEMILHADRRLFFYINGVWHNHFLDMLMPLLRNPYAWSPLYLFLLLFIIINYRWRGIFWCLFFLATFALTDYINSQVIKEWVQRLRPCHDPFMSQYVRSVISCGGMYGFPSSHASNHFGLAMFMFGTLHHYIGRWMYIAFAWAFIICYAQVYVGVHYPLDILGGCILGLFFGIITSRIFNHQIGLIPAA